MGDRQRMGRPPMNRGAYRGGVLYPPAPVPVTSMTATSPVSPVACVTIPVA